MKVFSFCLYGTERNYYDGLLENIEIITKEFPDFQIYVYKGICDCSWVLEGSNLKIIETTRSGAINMLYRYLPLGFADIGFIRDADSRITERDQWCIHQFIQSDKHYHIVRDHYWHKEPIMGGIFGWKRPINLHFQLDQEIQYSQDMTYLKDHLYPLIKSESLVHTNNHAFVGEYVQLITIPQKDEWDFIGNVIWNNKPKFTYEIGNRFDQLNFLRSQDQFVLCRHLSDALTLLEIPYHRRSNIIDIAYTANFYLQSYEKCQYWLSQYEFADITVHTYQNSNYLFPQLGKKIVASFDPNREPSNDEIVIVYGNYPDWHLGLPISSKIYRHASMFFQLKHDVIEYNSAWEPVDTIYILNLPARTDRFNDTLLALCAVHAPIHRIHHYKADTSLPPYIGATQNHVDVMKHFTNSGKSNCLILEDDVLFLDDRTCVWDSLHTFFSRNYMYTVCFLSISKLGPRQPLDDFLSITKQDCTTSSAYFLSSKTVQSVYETANEGLENMKDRNGNHHTNCIDRYWTKLDNLVYFKKKLVFQRPSFSNLTKQVNFMLD